MTADKTAAPDFLFEIKKDMVLLTPLTHRAYDLCRYNRRNTPMWGRSYMLERQAAFAFRAFIETKAHLADPSNPKQPYIVQVKR